MPTNESTGAQSSRVINRLRHIPSWSDTEWLVWGFGVLVLLSIFGAVGFQFWPLVGLPALALILYLSVVDFKNIFWLLIACLPLSTEIVLPNGFGTDLPTEPLMIGLTGIAILFALRHTEYVQGDFLRHPVTLLLLGHLGWILVSTVTSDLPFVSVKFFLAKTWYIIPFYFLAGYLLDRQVHVRRLFWAFFLPLLLTVGIIMVRHGLQGFTFNSIHYVLSPFQRNHVNYAAMLAYFLPVLFFARSYYRPRSITWWLLTGSTVFLLIAVYLTYTRAAYVALFGAAVMYVVFRLRMVRLILLTAVVAVALGLAYFIRNNTYLEYAPNYDRTVTHYEFDNLLEATYKMEDISTMERVYRWVAGFNMTDQNPVFGFGPGNFVNFYERYTVTSFRTYVSDNPERSGIHSYYLMTLVEQGIVGVLLYLAFVFVVLLAGERIYHQTRDPVEKNLVMGFLLAIVVIDAFQIINDLLETDKVGPFFFVAVAVLVRQDIRNQRLGRRPQVERSSSDQSSG